MSSSTPVVTDVFTQPGMPSIVRKQTAVATVTRIENGMMRACREICISSTQSKWK